MLTQEDYWSGFVEVIVRQHQRIQFKYLVAGYDDPMSNFIEWEMGQYNRQIVISGDEDHIVLCKYILIKKMFGDQTKFV